MQAIEEVMRRPSPAPRPQVARQRWHVSVDGFARHVPRLRDRSPDVDRPRGGSGAGQPVGHDLRRQRVARDLRRDAGRQPLRAAADPGPRLQVARRRSRAPRTPARISASTAIGCSSASGTIDASSRSTNAANAVEVVRVPHGICGQVVVDGSFYLATTDDEESSDYWLTRVDLRGAEPHVEDVAYIGFPARALAFDGERFWTNHREQHEIVAFAAARYVVDSLARSASDLESCCTIVDTIIMMTAPIR